MRSCFLFFGPVPGPSLPLSCLAAAALRSVPFFVCSGFFRRFSVLLGDPLRRSPPSAVPPFSDPPFWTSSLPVGAPSASHCRVRIFFFLSCRQIFFGASYWRGVVNSDLEELCAIVEFPAEDWVCWLLCWGFVFVWVWFLCVWGGGGFCVGVLFVGSASNDGAVRFTPFGGICDLLEGLWFWWPANFPIPRPTQDCYNCRFVSLFTPPFFCGSFHHKNPHSICGFFPFCLFPFISTHTLIRAYNHLAPERNYVFHEWTPIATSTFFSPASSRGFFSDFFSGGLVFSQ